MHTLRALTVNQYSREKAYTIWMCILTVVAAIQRDYAKDYSFANIINPLPLLPLANKVILPLKKNYAFSLNNLFYYARAIVFL